MKNHDARGVQVALPTIADVKRRYQAWRHGSPAQLFLSGLAIIGSLASVVSVVNSANSHNSSIRDVVAAIVFLGSVVAAWISSRFYQRTRRRSRYAESMFYVHYVIHHLRDEINRIETLELKNGHLQGEAKRVAILALDAICFAFAIVSGAKCRATIKVLSRSELIDRQTVTRTDMANHGSVQVFARDSMSASVLAGQADSPSMFSKNPRFADLLKDPRKRYYYCDTCYDSNHHLTCSREKYPDGLPYQTVLVLPIRLPYTAMLSTTSKSDELTQRLVGFLVIDCHRPRAFELPFDFELGAVFADALYGFLDRCHIKYYSDESRSNALPEPIRRDFDPASVD